VGSHAGLCGGGVELGNAAKSGSCLVFTSALPAILCYGCNVSVLPGQCGREHGPAAAPVHGGIGPGSAQAGVEGGKTQLAVLASVAL
jgi:hypothetical protein